MCIFNVRTHSLILEISQPLGLEYFLFSFSGIPIICMLDLLGLSHFILQEPLYLIFPCLCAAFHEISSAVFSSMPILSSTTTNLLYNPPTEILFYTAMTI